MSICLSFLFAIISVLDFQSVTCVPSEGTYLTKLAFKALKGTVIELSKAEDKFDCVWKCERRSDCLSLNLATRPDTDGLYECVLMANHQDDPSGVSLESSTTYHHYTRSVDASSRCFNGGTCETTPDNHCLCHCPQGFRGAFCQIAYQWHKINVSPVCFGAKGSSYGTFYVKKTGKVLTFKLVHLSGYVSCSFSYSSAKSDWGCAPFLTYTDTLMTIITNNQNIKILPQDEFISSSARLEYSLPGFTSKSPEIVFKNFTTPLDVMAGQEFRIWYGQDLKKSLDGNNDGTSCADVYVYGLLE
ncbi:uncharacterized protein LOC116299252 isoform X1 [Actinia tenebrosa]|uniref:Uncharacterized protein LOC116299252 isoform X1 n=1 Tax=Actinia tenebrosa TaxID=6105 RepID=A0A6P8ICX5_ACTTE|nr:uncharacterized protein LOC116299252 isoform X1 [Actinia tenebrosa]